MTTHVATVAPSTDVITAARLLLGRGCRQLPVVDAGRVVGLLSRRDVIRFLVDASDD